MLRFSVQLFGVTVLCLGLIWFVGSGEASNLDNETEPVLWADTVHINLDQVEGSQGEEPENPAKKRDDFLRDVKKLTHVAFNVRNNYMEDIDSEELIKAGIRGMLSDLDRFSVLMEKSQYDNLMESTHGKYEGLGMQIDARENRIIIVSPIEGTPAYRRGLRAGDIIWEINGKSTEGMTSADASKLMRGKAGTSVNLTIKRAGLEKPIEFEIERAIIELKSVNYAGVIPGTDIGYVRLSRFAEETSHELRDAVSELNDKGISSLVFDLRSNGGGLLDQAKETAELFLGNGKEIVYTKGKFENSERHYVSEKSALYPEDKPLVILVDQGTASASEIVAGAVQDWDRGLIVGNTTYGKGLVQQIFPISNDGSMALKLTTAKYYVPSGRCIQKPETQVKRGSRAAREMEEEAEEEAADSMTVSEDEIYYTNGGRMVYGGGGIVPDVEIERDLWKPIEINLERQSMFFDFAVQYVADHPDLTADFEVTDEVVQQFRAFTEEKEFDYTSTLEAAYEDMLSTMEEEEKTEAFQPLLDSLRAQIEMEKEADFDRSLDYIKRTIKREIIAAVAGETGVYETVILQNDKTIQRAIEILHADGEYTRQMASGMEKPSLN
ncbi:PDZ domain-containing protein [candidate division GN15 bacterium]|nr:PDZ domain-containing protein [candidate division GN15 bacterium]